MQLVHPLIHRLFLCDVITFEHSLVSVFFFTTQGDKQASFLLHRNIGPEESFRSRSEEQPVFNEKGYF